MTSERRWLYVRKWAEWQTYRSDRGKPPWIKVYRRLLQDLDWSSLTDAEKGQLVSIWILAADRDGYIPDEPDALQRVLGLETPPNLSRFKDLEFLVPVGRQPNVNVTSTRRQHDAPEEGKRKGSKDNTPPVSPPTGGGAPRGKRGQRLPDDFTLTDERLTVATEIGLSANQARFEFDKFTDHWRASSGQNARKLDWEATWRNWCRRSLEQRQQRSGGNGLDEVAWANLMQHVRDGHGSDQVTAADPVLAKAVEWLGGMSKLRRMNEHEINRERAKFGTLYQQARQETGND